MMNESRFRMIEAADPARFQRLARDAGEEAARRITLYRHIAEWKPPGAPQPASAGTAEK